MTGWLRCASASRALPLLQCDPPRVAGRPARRQRDRRSALAPGRRCVRERPPEEFRRAGRLAYSASKWGLRGITKSFALEAGPHNINVNCVAPGMVDGPRFREKVCANMATKLGISLEEAMQRHAEDYALKRVTLDEDVANACLFLASDVSRQITGVDLPVDGGWAML